MAVETKPKLPIIRYGSQQRKIITPVIINADGFAKTNRNPDHLTSILSTVVLQLTGYVDLTSIDEILGMSDCYHRLLAIPISLIPDQVIQEATGGMLQNAQELTAYRPQSFEPGKPFFPQECSNALIVCNPANIISTARYYGTFYDYETNSQRLDETGFPISKVDLKKDVIPLPLTLAVSGAGLN
ncbi:hypothetical protein C4564_05435 [Candidatus Microgenomates bacterium]|nr:MAG: hypothetical protein C4564_05435 [Candidatus Microgenomates bacterium]